MSETRAVPQVLARALESGRLVPFVGAGVSRSIRFRNGEYAFPTWNELLLRGAKWLRDEEGNDDVAKLVELGVRTSELPPTQIAAIIKKELGGGWSRFLRAQLDPKQAQIDPESLSLAKAIWSLGSNLVITTNYDRVLTWACPQEGDVSRLDVDNYAEFTEVLSNEIDRPMVWHLHGHVDKIASLTLTSESYAELYAEGGERPAKHKAAIVTLQGVMAQRCLAFIGFSFSDEYIVGQVTTFAKTFNGCGGPHMAFVCLRERERAEPLLEELGLKPIYFEDFGKPLLDLLAALARARFVKPSRFPSSSKPVSLVGLGPDPAPKPPEDRWSTARQISLLDHLGPAYLLDRSYFFMDWNPAFEMLFAKPLGLYRGQHAQEFIRHLVNKELVETRSKQKFGGEEIPLVDLEPLFFKSQSYGLMKLWKIAAQIADEEGDTFAWSVALNILEAEHLDELWTDLEITLQERVNWSHYAAAYDKILSEFSEYRKLIKLVASKVPGTLVCDLGAGTGNGTLELLVQNPDRRVWAIEPNEEMLRRLRDKLNRNEHAGNEVYVVKQEIDNLREFGDGYFEGAIMVNVLYALEEPQACVNEIYRILKRGGVLALSTSHSSTDVERIFSTMEAEYAQKGMLETLQKSIDLARERHRQMLRKIVRDTKEDIRRYLETAGFRIAEWLDDQYTGAVVVVKAVKP